MASTAQQHASREDSSRSSSSAGGSPHEEDTVDEIKDELAIHVRQCIGPPSPVQRARGDGTVIELDDFTIHGVVGRGKFSTVYLATRTSDGLTVALKKIKLGCGHGDNHRMRQKCLREVELLQSLDHANIIRYLDSFLAPPNSLGIVFEWATAGDLRKHLNSIRDRGIRLPESVIWKSFVQICNALAHMHEKRVLHRDLKPANIFLMKDGSLKVGDLGLGRTLSDDTPEAFSKVGTPLYMSPESLKGESYGEKSDIWSLGCILYEMAMLRSPFKKPGLKMFELFQLIIDGQYPPVTPEVYSTFLVQLVTLMLSSSPVDRPDIFRTRAIAMLSLNECLKQKILRDEYGAVSTNNVNDVAKSKLNADLEESVQRHFTTTNKTRDNDAETGSDVVQNFTGPSFGVGLSQREKDLVQRAYMAGSGCADKDRVDLAWRATEKAAEKYAALRGDAIAHRRAVTKDPVVNAPKQQSTPGESGNRSSMQVGDGTMMKKMSPITFKNKEPFQRLGDKSINTPHSHLGRRKMGSPPILPPLENMVISNGGSKFGVTKGNGKPGNLLAINKPKM